MAPELVSSRQYLGWGLRERTQLAQHCVEIPFSGDEAIIEYSEKQDLRPVHVIKNGEEEIINYRAKLMEDGKPYKVEWYGLKIALIKREDAIKMVMEDEI